MAAHPFSLPFRRDDRFIGRASELAEIHAALQRSNVVVVRAARDAGGGGMGTTALVMEYAYRYREAYQGVIGAVHEGKLGGRRWDTNPWDALSPRAPAPWGARDVRRRMRHAMQQQQRSEPPIGLFVSIGGALPSKSPAQIAGAGKALFTTDGYDLALSSTTVDIGPLQRRDAFALLGPCVDRDPHGARALVDATQGIPLALRLVAATLDEAPDRPLRDILSFFSTQDDTESPQIAMAGAFRLAWDALASEDARRVLRLLSLLPARMAVSMAPIQALLSEDGDDADRLATGVSLLLRRKLLEERTDGRVSLHPRIAELVKATVLDVEAFVTACDERLSSRLADLDWLEEAVHVRGVQAVLENADAVGWLHTRNNLGYVHSSASRPIVDLLRRIAERRRDATRTRTLFLQQIALADALPPRTEGKLTELCVQAQRRLEERAEPHFQLRTQAGTRSGARDRAGDWNAAAFCLDGCHAITAAQGGHVAIWDAARGETVEERSLDATFHRAPVIAPEGLVLAGQTNHGIELFDLTDGASLGVVTKNQGQVALTPDGRYLAILGSDATVSHYDLRKPTPPRQTRIEKATLSPSPRARASRIALSNDGQRVFVLMDDRRLCVWDVAKERYELHTHVDPSALQPTMPVMPFHALHDEARLVVSGDGRSAISTLPDQLVAWELAPRVHGRVLLELPDELQSLALTGDGGFLLVIAEGCVLIWERVSGQIVSVAPVEVGYVSRSEEIPLSVSRDGRMILVAFPIPIFLTWHRHDRNQ
ncbi:WD40 repeat domain-containing protein [Polyangium jinanense]|uniref:WD40 repeat domain-containing protein n=1 Tax=Polyangium jinanense TaxID=2829994 RepID=A0A9X3XA88_9BACT|nr:WD40 repeat domain-containing protein [Polyangium jinanense]MDC3959615.1 WD40 repeat domain-containing protein [Polyangium jinanense]MDC3986537.1 WD40 repeat domain-containing protein [Polyangium jinanense]